MTTQTVNIKVLAVKVESRYDGRGALTTVRLTSGKGDQTVRTSWIKVDPEKRWIQRIINYLNAQRERVDWPRLDDEQVSLLRGYLS